MGRGIGQDAKARGVRIMLGPGVNIYRSAAHFSRKPLYSFGFGLSYSKFEYEKMAVVPASGSTFDVTVSLAKGESRTVTVTLPA